MNTARTFGAAVFIFGMILSAITSDVMPRSAGQLSDALSAGHAGGAVEYMIIGIAAVVSGGLLTIFAKRI